ncbi:MAG: hypothetical protein ETSY2_42010 [Candidatus Entotheonella gemina]|uniref:Peptidase A2 domain-containing protein n=1 Tax=Candidatus Entotheonella gemina TaxID=1429439 RepID=W4LLX0_9BACT|nr:MAG: hypothetical protein ETSY2_42010 [Candidatus Entotheonella gemina]
MSTSSSSEGGEAPAVAHVAAPAAGLHGFVTPFDATQEEWSEYVERLEHYFTANDITAVAKRRAILLHAVGPKTYRLIKTLVSPALVTELTFEDIVVKAKAHFNPKPSPIVKRFEFNTRRQGEGETVATFVAELRKLAEYCEYGDVLNDMLRDRVVCGISNKAVQRRLLQESALTFEKALEMALAAETAEKDARRLTDDATEREQVKDTLPSETRVNKVDGPKLNKSPQSQSGTRRDCHRCGGKHQPSRCAFKEYECHFCKKKGHLAKVCRKKAATKTEQANVIVKDDNQEEPEEYTHMWHVSTGSSKPLQVTLNANGNRLVMEIDTGASVSVVSEETFNTIREGLSTLELQESTVKLQTYTGEKIGVKGSTTIQVEHNGQTILLPLIVTQGRGPTLLGRDWLAALRLDWETIFSVGSKCTLQEVLDNTVMSSERDSESCRGCKLRSM